MSGPTTHRNLVSGAPARRALRVLIVEDSENDAALLLRELRRGGYEPDYERVDTPEDMERALAGDGEPWELVISDYFMPRFRAPEALALLRRLGHDTPFIVVSGKVGEELAVEAMRSGAQDYITKENMTRLNAAIERELREAEERRERRRAEEALSRSENRFQRLVEQAADAIFVYEPDGCFLDVNRRACESLGYTREELLEMSVPDIEVDYAPEELRELRRSLVPGTPITIEGTHRRKDGTTFPVEVRVSLLESEGRKLILTLVRDVTERKEAEKRIRETETRYKALVEQIPAVTYIQNPIESANPKAVTYMSPQYEAMLGYRYESGTINEERWLGILHPEDRERVLAEEARTDATGEPFSVEYRAIAADGRVVWVRDQAVLVRDEEGKPLYWQGVQYDITDQKRVEENLRESEERYRTFISQSTEGIWRIELEEPLSLESTDQEMVEHAYRHGYLAECNDAMARMYGYEHAEELVGARLGDLLPVSEPENLDLLMRFVRSGCRLTDAESREFDREGNARTFLNNLNGIVEGGMLVRIWGTQRDITERRRIEVALQQAEEKYRGIFENSVEGIFQTALDGRLLTANPALARMLGYESPEEMLRTVTDVGRQVYANPQQRREFLRILRKDDVVSGYEIRALRKDGSEVLLSLNARMIRDETGEFVAAEGSAENITERKRAEEELRESEERFRATFDQASVGFLQVGLEGEWLRFNDKFCDIIGYSREELSQISVFDLITPEDFERDFERGVNMLAGEIQDYNEEKLVIGKDGRQVWINLTVSLVYGVDDEPRYFIAVAEDISERKWAEEELRLRERAIDASLNGIVLTDPNQPNNPIVYVNPAFERITGYSSSEVVGRNCRFLQGDERDQPGLAELREAIREQRECRVVLKNYRKDGTLFWNELSVSPVFDERGRLIRFVGVQDDITERRRAEEEQRLLAETGSVLSSSLDYRTTLAGVARLAVPGFADWCAIDVTEEDGSLNRLAVAHEDPEKIALAHELQRRYPPDPDAPGGSRQVLRTGQPVFYPEILDEMLVAGARDEEHARLLREIGFTSAIIVPLVARGRTLGVITLVSAESGRRYEAADLELAEELARRAALAVDNAGLFEEAQREISEREIAEREMRNSRDQLEVILRGVTDGITAQGPDGRLVYANEAAAAIVGYPSAQALVEAPPREVLDKFEILDESGRPLPHSMLPGRLALQGEPSHERLVCFHEVEAGVERWAVVGATPIFDEQGDVRLVVNIFRDVTEQRRAQEALQISEARFRTMIEQSPLSIQILSPYGRTLQVNRAWEEMWGTNLEGLGDYNLLEDRQLVDQGVMPQILRGFAGEPALIPPIAYDREQSVPGLSQLDEPTLWVRAYIYPVKDEAGKVREVVLMHEDVTDRKRSEEELIWLASFPMLNPNPIVETNLVGEPTYLNPAAEAQFKDVRTLGARHPALADLKGAHEKIWASGGRPIMREVRVGERFYQQTISRVPEGDLLRIYTTDTTERRRAEEAVRASEERFRSLVQNASDVIVVLDAAGKILYESPAIERILGFTAEERIGTTAFDYIHPDDLDQVKESFARYVGGSDFHATVEYRARAKDGTWHYFEAVGTNLLEDPAVEGIVVNTRDVTERRVAEEALLQSEELYRTVVEQAAENIFVVDVETKEILEANAALGLSLGYTDEEVRRMTLYDIVDHERESVDENVERILASGRSFLGERVYRRKDGTSVDVEVSVSAIPYRGKNVMCIVAHDITERKRIEEAMREVREAERNRIARDLHDDILQNMVYALQEIQILQITTEDGGDPALEDTADALRRSVEGLRVAIFELRLSETLERSFASSMQALLEVNRRMARQRFTVEMSVADEFPQDIPESKAKELVRIVQEALSNARRHASPSHVWIELGIDGETAWAQVTDDGRGFVPADSGGGVGMSSMRQRALDLGGEIEIESQPGRGTRMRFEIPLERLNEE